MKVVIEEFCCRTSTNILRTPPFTWNELGLDNESQDKATDIKELDIVSEYRFTVRINFVSTNTLPIMPPRQHISFP